MRWRALGICHGAQCQSPGLGAGTSKTTASPLSSVQGCKGTAAREEQAKGCCDHILHLSFMSLSLHGHCIDIPLTDFQSSCSPSGSCPVACILSSSLLVMFGISCERFMRPRSISTEAMPRQGLPEQRNHTVSWHNNVSQLPA